MTKIKHKPTKSDSIDPEQLRAFMRIKPTIKDTAAFFSVSVSTIERYIKEHFPETPTFDAFREQNMVHTRHDLIRKAIQMANSGNVPMLIFALKNLCGWGDKSEIEVNVPKPYLIERIEGGHLELGAKLIEGDK